MGLCDPGSDSVWCLRGELMVYILHLYRDQIILLAVADLNNGCFCNGKGWNWFSCTSPSEKRAESSWAKSTYGCNSPGAAASELFITVEHVIVHNAAETFLFLWLKGICFWLVCNCSTLEYLVGLWMWNISGTSAYQSYLKTPKQNGLVTNTSRTNNGLYKIVL